MTDILKIIARIRPPHQEWLDKPGVSIGQRCDSNTIVCLCDALEAAVKGLNCYSPGCYLENPLERCGYCKTITSIASKLEEGGTK